MKRRTLLVCFLMLSIRLWGQESLTVRVCLNTAEGAGMKGVGIRINGIGNSLTDNDGFSIFLNLRTSHQKTTGEAITLFASLSGYAVVNNYDVSDYTLPKDRSKPFVIILAKTAEREKYALQYLEGIAKVSLERVFETREKSLRQQIDKAVADYKSLVSSSSTEREQYQRRIDSLYKQVDLVQKQQVEAGNTAEQIGRILSQIQEPDEMLNKAYKFLKDSKFQEAQQVLDEGQLDKDKEAYEQEERLVEAHVRLAKKRKDNYITKCLLKADLYRLEPQPLAAESWFEKAYQADSMRIQTLFNYAYFLQQQNRSKRPAILYERALKIYEDLAQKVPEQYLPDVATTLNNLGNFYSDNQQKSEAQAAYERALAIYEGLALKNPEQYLPDLAGTLNNLGLFYSDNQQKSEAQAAYERALEIYEGLSRKNPEQYLPSLATTLNNLGNFYSANQKKAEAQAAYERALEIYEGLSLKNSEQYLPDLAMTLNNLGVFYSDNQKKSEAQAAYERALEIREGLARKNPEQYLPSLATTLNNLGNFYRANQKKSEAQAAYERALEIREGLSRKNPEQYLPSLATTLNNLGVFYSDNQKKSEAQAAYERALAIRAGLARKNPEQYLPDLAMTLNNLGVFYSANQKKSEAQAAYERALEIREDLARKNPEQYLPDVAMTLNNLGIFYSANQKKSEAQVAYERALAIREDLARKNPDQYLPDLATTLNNLGIFYSDNQKKVEAQVAYERALEIREDLSRKNPEQYLPDLAMTQINYGVFFIENNNFPAGEALLIKGAKNYQYLAKRFDNILFWQKTLSIIEFLPEVIEMDSVYIQKLAMQETIIGFYEVYPATKNTILASSYGNAAWYALFCKQSVQAEHYARKGLSVDTSQHWIYTNLALALLLQDRWAEAQEIYQTKQNLSGNNEKPLKEAFLNDLITLEQAGISHPDFEKVRKMFR
ncbi:tetratricopeptide repeat protein [Emticicia sp. 17c]|uniref:tetratricopeptide repeat protein n=1 Tax=Emticicia sp. 17c TaxID=3127704 RepID=UPI00301C1C48